MTSLAAALALTILAAGPCDPAEPAGLWQKTLRILGIPANPGTKGEKEPPPAGDLYRTLADGSGARIRVTDGGGYRSPIFASDDRHALALQQGQLVRVALDRGVVTRPDFLMDLPDVVRLAGFSEDDSDLLVVLRDKQGHRQAAMVCLESRRLAELVVGGKEELTRLLKRLRSAERHYGDTVLASAENAKGGRDVTLRTGNRTVAVSQCEGDVCTQGALSGDRRQVVFVRTLRMNESGTGSPKSCPVAKPESQPRQGVGPWPGV